MNEAVRSFVETADELTRALRRYAEKVEMRCCEHHNWVTDFNARCNADVGTARPSFPILPPLRVQQHSSLAAATADSESEFAAADDLGKRQPGEDHVSASSADTDLQHKRQNSHEEHAIFNPLYSEERIRVTRETSQRLFIDAISQKQGP